MPNPSVSAVEASGRWRALALLALAGSALMPVLVHEVAWRQAFAFLAPGPVFGVASMLRLRAHPEAVKIAQGRR